MQWHGRIFISNALYQVKEARLKGYVLYMIPLHDILAKKNYVGKNTNRSMVVGGLRWGESFTTKGNGVIWRDD
jgi:hypothetical protein